MDNTTAKIKERWQHVASNLLASPCATTRYIFRRIKDILQTQKIQKMQQIADALGAEPMHKLKAAQQGEYDDEHIDFCKKVHKVLYIDLSKIGAIKKDPTLGSYVFDDELWQQVLDKLALGEDYAAQAAQEEANRQNEGDA